ncbi:MAG: hypothetical protein RBS19_00395 [Bacteroidales bacterium]|nr:hypothetical protein [Bacteroidales bacterium]
MRTKGPLEILETNVEVYPFTDDYYKIFGEPDIRFSTIIRGEAKSGKSTYAAKFAQYVSQFGKVLYVSAEERLNSKTLQNRLRYCKVESPKVRFIHEKHIDKIEAKIRTGGFRFVIIDSVQHVQMTYDEFEAMRHAFKRRKISWHLIMQMGVNITKWKHEVDVLVEVKNGWAQVHGRYNAASRIRVLENQSSQTSLF